MAVERPQAIQNQTVRLKMYFRHNNELDDPYSLGSVQILNPSDSVIATLTPTQESTGIYYVDYPISAAAVSGWYTDRWGSIIYGYGWDTQTVDANFYVQISSYDAINPQTCRVYDYVYYSDGTTRANSTGYATITTLPYDYSNALYSNPDRLSTTGEGKEKASDATGYIYWDIVWGATVAFEIEDAGVGKTVLIPEQASVRLSDLTAII